MKNIKLYKILLIIVSLSLISSCSNHTQNDLTTNMESSPESTIEQTNDNTTRKNFEEVTAIFETESSTKEHTTFKPIINHDIMTTTCETTTNQYFPPVTATQPTTESTTSLRDIFNPTIIYDSPITVASNNPASTYVMKAQVLQYSIKTLPRNASITLELQLVEKSGDPYLGYWYFQLDEVLFYDKDGTFLGSTYFAAGELSNYEVGDIFTGTIYDIPLETTKIVMKNKIKR